MSTLELVLWLQSGRHFDTRLAPDAGFVPRGHEAPRYDGAMLVPAHEACQPIPVVMLSFQLTTEYAEAREQYHLGRRRFHYCETSGWLSPDERYESDLNRGQRAFIKFAEQRVRERRLHAALLAVGAFPVHSCAPPPHFNMLQLLGVEPLVAPAWSSTAVSGVPVTKEMWDQLYLAQLKNTKQRLKQLGHWQYPKDLE